MEFDISAYMNGVGITWGHYESIDLNAATYAIKTTFPQGICSSSGWGMTVSYQTDGNVSQSANATHLGNLNLIYY